MIGRSAGVPLSDFLRLIHADPAAHFVTVQCADDYYESLDIATANHPRRCVGDTRNVVELYGDERMFEVPADSVNVCTADWKRTCLEAEEPS